MILKRPFLAFLSITITIFSLTGCEKNPETSYNELLQKGNSYYASNDFSNALSAWEKALELQPDSPVLYRKMGEIFLKQAKYSKALEAYNQLLRLQPEAWDIWLQVAKIHLQFLNLDAAEQCQQKFQHSLATPETKTFAGDLLAAKNDFNGAEKKYRQSLSLAPNYQPSLARLAICLLAEDKTSEAEDIFKLLQEMQPESSDIYIQMSNYWRLKNDFNKAEENISKAIEEDPTNMQLRIKMVELYIDIEDYQRAINFLKIFLKEMPENRLAKKMLIETFLIFNKFADAEKILNELTDSEQKDSDFLLLKGKYYLITLELYNAISMFQMVLEKEPKLPIAHYLLAIAYLAGGQDNLGQKSLIKTLTLNTQFSEAELTLADTYYKTGQYELALEHADRVKEREPEKFRSHQIMGNILLVTKQYKAALAEFQAANLLYPDHVTPLYYMALLWSLSGKQEVAKLTYQELLKKYPALANGVLDYTQILLLENRGDGAIHFLKDLINKSPANPYLHYLIGETYLRTGNKTAAINSFIQSLAIKQDIQSAYLKLFDLYSDDSEKLEKLLHDSISKVSNFTEAQIRLANLYCQKGQPIKGISLLQEALSANPKSPQLANNLAWLYLEYQPKDIDEAMRLAQLAYERLPNNAAVADTLGWIFFKKGMAQRAVWLLEQAYTLAPNNPLALFHLGMIKKNLGKNAEAQQYLSKALAANLTMPMRQQAIDTLNTQ
ncbi:tetratricopeptide repeat protein [Candidatus Parcubacteria bacterium]|nr:MAG: tetratricopeptide repeat protein [Candidatus Parcubacteria bacterium]